MPAQEIRLHRSGMCVGGPIPIPLVLKVGSGPSWGVATILGGLKKLATCNLALGINILEWSTRAVFQGVSLIKCKGTYF